jgi:hypothetical protein
MEGIYSEGHGHSIEADAKREFLRISLLLIVLEFDESVGSLNADGPSMLGGMVAVIVNPMRRGSLTIRQICLSKILTIQARFSGGTLVLLP